MRVSEQEVIYTKDAAIGAALNKDGGLTAAAAVAKPTLVQLSKYLSRDAFEQAWAQLEQWQPAQQRSPAENVQDLKQRYLSIKSHLSKSADAALQAKLLPRLDALVAQHLETLLAGSYGTLLDFLMGNHQQLAALAIKFSLLSFILTDSAQNAPAWPDGLFQWASGSSFAAPLKTTGAAPHPNENGMLSYGPDGDKTSHTQHQLLQSKFSGEPTDNMVISTSQRHALKMRFPKPLTLMELAKGNAFARHMAGTTPSVSTAAPTAQPSEWVGLRAGMIWLKGQLLIQDASVSRPFAHMIQNAVDEQVNTALRQPQFTQEASPAPPGGVRGHANQGQRIVFSSYQNAMNYFKRTNVARETILNCIADQIKTAMEQDETQQQLMKLHDPKWSKNKGELTTQWVERYMKEHRAWLQQIQREWNQYLDDMGQYRDAYLDFSRYQERRSIGALLLPGLEKPPPLPQVSLATILGWCGGGCILMIVLYWLSSIL